MGLDDYASSLGYGSLLGSANPLNRSSGGGTPANTSYLGINRNAKDYASQVQAALSRRDFDEFMTTYFPLLQQQAAQVDNPAYMAKQVDQSRLLAGQGLDTSLATRERQFRSYGIEPTAEQRAVLDRGDTLTRTRADVTAANRAREQVRGREWTTLTGASAPKFGLDGIKS